MTGMASILHPTDFSTASANAFVHALAFALRFQSQLTLLHVGPDDEEEVAWTQFPAVRRTLALWGVLEEGQSHKEVLTALNLGVKKVALRGNNPTPVILDYMTRHPMDLMVLATHGREGLPRWMHRSVAEPLARRSQTMTLFVPQASRGFVSLQEGRLSFERVLVPIDHQPRPEAAIDAGTHLVRKLGLGPVAFELLHVGATATMPDVYLPQDPAWSWARTHRPGEVVEGVLHTARETAADLIVMVTAGHEGVLDALRGSTTEQVLRQAPCPVLAVPSAWMPLG